MKVKPALECFFNPEGCAVVGASRDPSKPGHQVLKAMMQAGYRGSLFAVNPGEREIMGLECYPDISSIPGPVELAVMCAPLRVLDSFVVDMQQRARTRGDLGGVVCTTAGFAEEGTLEGVARQEALARACREVSVRLMGPNCIGVIDTLNGVDTTFLLGTDYQQGGISVISQSGAIGAWLVQSWSTHAAPVGFSKFVSLGNTADVDVREVLEYLKEDESTRVIGMYLEGVRDGRGLVETMGKVAREKTVLVLKTGRTLQGVEAARSHTGAMAGQDRIWDSAFRQHGVVRVQTVEDLLDSLRAFDRLPDPPNDRVFVLTHAGGPGVYSVDFFSSWEGMGMATVSPDTKDALRSMLPPIAAVCRPEGHTDMTASATARQFGQAVNLLMADEGVGGTVFLYFPTAHMGAEEVVNFILREMELPLKKPFLPTLMVGKWVREGRRILEESGIPTFNNPERAGKTFLNMCRRVATRSGAMRERPPTAPVPGAAQAVIDSARCAGRRALTEPESARLLESYGVPVAPWGVAKTAEEALAVARRVGYPVAVKVVSPGIPHKSDAGCVRLNIAGDEDLSEAVGQVLEAGSRVPGASIHGVLVQSMVKGVAEVILGGIREVVFGPVVMVGLGGLLAEIWNDASFRLAPLLPEEAQEMVEEVKSMAVLNGLRGMTPGDKTALFHAVQAVSQAAACPGILEIDVNPLVVLEEGKGVLAVDALVTLE
ncbi:MAG: acetate--CoA ligase family protein [Bacillota bacterium]